jgi:hypothetical protein
MSTDTTTGWQCDNHPGRPAITHFFTGWGGHGWACGECVPLDNAYDMLELSTDPDCPWPHAHNRL